MLLGFVGVYWNSNRSPVDSGRNRSANLVARFLEVERRESEVEGLSWRQEIVAQGREAYFLDMWNRLNGSNDRWGELMVSNAEMVIPNDLQKEGEPVSLVNVLRFDVASGGTRTLSALEWRDQVGRWKSEGWQLGRTRWNLIAFRSDGVQEDFATIQFSAQVFRESSNVRVTIRGTFEARWAFNAIPGSGPFRMEIRSLELGLGEEVKGFSRKLSLALQPDGISHFPDPLILQDVDGDGFVDILLPGANLLVRNQEGEFTAEKLGKLPAGMVSCAVSLDFGGRGRPDLLLGVREGLYLLENDLNGGFGQRSRWLWKAGAALKHPQVMTVGDVDGDGLMDLWLGQYKVPYQGGQFPTPFYDANDGFASYLLMNDGRGGFVDRTEQSGLGRKRHRRTYSASFIDVEGDGDLDLVNVSDFAGVDYYLNQGNGRFADATASLGEARHLFGMAHAFGDLNGDGAVDLFAIGMDSPVASRLGSMGLNRVGFEHFASKRTAMTEGNRLFLNGKKGWEAASMAPGLSRAGWAWGVSMLDFDNDGDLDIAVANGHETFPDVTDHERQFWLHDIYVGGSDNDPVREMYFKSAFGKRLAQRRSYGGWQDNAFFVNGGSGRFFDAAFQLGVAVPEDSQCLAAADLDRDGRMDLVMVSFTASPQRQPRLEIYRNVVGGTNGWVGLRFPGAPVETSGARVDVTTDLGTYSRWLVTGDSYRTQHPAEAHFGLGRSTRILGVEVRWPGGKVTQLGSMEANRWHEVRR